MATNRAETIDHGFKARHCRKASTAFSTEDDESISTNPIPARAWKFLGVSADRSTQKRSSIVKYSLFTPSLTVNKHSDRVS
ncbi:hypothetical protein HJC23_008820 [Cyclotella cryptica]|uniref:Uncharacterized protein n=1 Tax=Cyclotella cryptica TaxID=29204 RepID=A0ABD3Q9Y0_9STRA